MDTSLLVAHFFEFKRAPEPLLIALRQDPIVLQNLWIVGSFAKLIASPRDVEVLLQYLETNGILWGDGTRLMEPGQLERLKRWHIICTEDFRERVLEAITNRPGTGVDGGTGKQGIQIRRRKWIAIPMTMA